MTPLSSLGIFLTLSFIMPGIVIIASGVILFYDLRLAIEHLSIVEIVAGIIVVSFLNGHFVFLYEVHALDYMWDRMYPRFRILERRGIAAERSKIISSAEAKGINHAHLDMVFGEFIFYTNTGFWVFLLSFCKVPFCRGAVEVAICVFMLVTACVTLLATSPFYKNQYVSALEVLQDRIRQEVLLPSKGERGDSEAAGEVDLAIAHEYEAHHSVVTEIHT